MNERGNCAKLLSQIHENLSENCTVLSATVSGIDDKFLLRCVTGQLEHYSALCKKTEDVMNVYGVRPKKESIFDTARIRGGVYMNTLFDSSDSHIAEMIERGTRRRAMELERAMSEAGQGTCDEVTIGLCREVIDSEMREADCVRDFI